MYVPEGSELIGQTIKNAFPSEKDINVLTLYRGNKVIPNPRHERDMMAEDRLLCFGKMESMRGMIPMKTRNQRKPKVQVLPDVPDVPDVPEA
ncbi:MAG: TrkA C-terminal domain-containing protein [Oceanococcus sp.]